MSELAETYDHSGKPVKHGRLRINGIRMHYITAGEGPPLLLLHGTPKNSFYWYRLFPLLTKHFTLVAPDLRGFGYTDKPPTTDGYDCKVNAEDMADLMTQLGHDKFHLHGEDRGADFAYAVAGLYRERVLTLSFCEMLLSGLGLEESSFWTEENVTAQFRQDGVWCWVYYIFPGLSLQLIIYSILASSTSHMCPRCSFKGTKKSFGKCSSNKSALTRCRSNREPSTIGSSV